VGNTTRRSRVPGRSLGSGESTTTTVESSRTQTEELPFNLQKWREVGELLDHWSECGATPTKDHP